MRVVNVVWTMSDQSGGLARAVVLIASAQARAGHDVTVVTTTDPHDTFEGLDDLDPRVRVQRFGRSRTTGRFAGSTGLRRWLRRNLDPTCVVHVHGVWDLAAQHGARVAKRSGARLLVSPHCSLDPYDVRKHAGAKRVLGPMFVRAMLSDATVVCTTRQEATSLVSYGARPAVEVVPLPVAPITGPAGDPEALRAALGLPAGAPVLLFLGRIDPKKGLEHVVDALPLMRTRPTLVVVGDGDPAYVEEVRGRAVQRGVADRVVWAGWRSGPDKAAAFGLADVFVLLSYAENYGLAVVEALQHGALICATREVDAAADLAESGAAVLTTRDPQTSAATLDRCLTDHQLRSDTLSAARAVLAGPLAPYASDSRYDALVTRPTPPPAKEYSDA